ncbi:MAG: hypothetical protein MI740_18430 [Halanaerobiales bacterium]|nr:hypothetical protein [Halanaerobiales bacterium]
MKRVSLLLIFFGLASIFFSLAVVASGWSEPRVWEQSGASVDRMPWYDPPTKTLYFIRDYNIYQSSFVNTAWTKPVEVEIPGLNTRQNQVNPVKRGNHLYFASYFPATDYDFYMTTWNQETETWGEAVRLTELSGEDQDWALWVNTAETEAYLISKGPFGDQQVRGGRGVWKAVKSDGEWQRPRPLTGAINSEGNEWSVFKDEQSGKIYIDSNRPGSLGSYDIWVLAGEDQTAVNLGRPINTELSERSLWTDGKVLFFSALDYENGIGGYDIFVSFYQD